MDSDLVDVVYPGGVLPSADKLSTRSLVQAPPSESTRNASRTQNSIQSRASTSREEISENDRSRKVSGACGGGNNSLDTHELPHLEIYASCTEEAPRNDTGVSGRSVTQRRKVYVLTPRFAITAEGAGGILCGGNITPRDSSSPRAPKGFPC